MKILLLSSLQAFYLSDIIQGKCWVQDLVNPQLRQIQQRQLMPQVQMCFHCILAIRASQEPEFYLFGPGNVGIGKQKNDNKLLSRETPLHMWIVCKPCSPGFQDFCPCLQVLYLFSVPESPPSFPSSVMPATTPFHAFMGFQGRWRTFQVWTPHCSSMLLIKTVLVVRSRGFKGRSNKE